MFGLLVHREKHVIVLLYVAAVITLSIFVNWWFVLALVPLAFSLPGLFKRLRVLKVLASEYQYDFAATSPQAFTLNRMERETRSQKLNDEELATLFMARMVNSLMSDGEEGRVFAKRVRYNAARLSANGSISGTIYVHFLAAVQEKVGRAA